MRIQGITAKELILDLKAAGAGDAIRELLEVLGRHRGLTPADVDVYHAEVLRRHSKIPSGLAHGLAFPNARLADLDRPMMAIGISAGGLDFQSRDGEPTHVIFLFLGRDHPEEGERQVLRSLSRALASPVVCRRLGEAATSEEVWACLLDIDKEQGGPSGTKGGRALRSFLVVDLNDETATTDQVRAGIEQAGGTVESVRAEKTRRGTPELSITLSTVESDLVGSIVKALGRLPGVAVRSVSQHAADGNGVSVMSP